MVALADIATCHEIWCACLLQILLLNTIFLVARGSVACSLSCLTRLSGSPEAQQAALNGPVSLSKSDSLATAALTVLTDSSIGWSASKKPALAFPFAYAVAAHLSVALMTAGLNNKRKASCGQVTVQDSLSWSRLC